MIFVVAFVLTISGAFLTYVATGLVRSQERRRGFLECEERLATLRRHFRERRQ